MGFPGGSDGKESAGNVGDPASNPGSGRSPEDGNGNPLQYSCLENSMDRGSWRAIVHGVRKCQTRLSDSHTHTHTHTHLCVLSRESCPTLCNPTDCSPPSSSPWDFPGENTGVGCHFHLQGIFLTQGSNPGLPHCRQML